MLFDPKWTPSETEVTKPEWKLLLERTADLIEQKGWCRHKLHDEVGGSCIMGALVLLVDNDTDGLIFSKAYTQFHTHLGRDPVAWNDFAAEDKEHVVRELRAAAK